MSVAAETTTSAISPPTALISGMTTLQVAINPAICGLLCGFFVLWIFIGVLVYRDAEGRGMSGIGWFFVVFLFGLIGIIIYLVVRKDRVTYYGPPAWGYSPSYTYRYPPPPTQAPPPLTTANAPAAPPPIPPTGVVVGRSCPTCEANVPPGASYCPNCGTRMT